MFKKILSFLLIAIALSPFQTEAAKKPQPAFVLANLTNPKKLATLGKRGANDRLNKVIYWMWHAQDNGFIPKTIIEDAQKLNNTPEPKASLVKKSLLNNYKIATQLGLLSRSNLKKLRQGLAPTIRQGPFKGERTEVDHIVPYSLAPEIGNELANLELMPSTLNRLKSDFVRDRQLSHATVLYKAGLLTKKSYKRVKDAYKLFPKIFSGNYSINNNAKPNLNPLQVAFLKGAHPSFFKLSNQALNRSFRISKQHARVFTEEKRVINTSKSS